MRSVSISAAFATVAAPAALLTTSIPTSCAFAPSATAFRSVPRDLPSSDGVSESHAHLSRPSSSSTASLTAAAESTPASSNTDLSDVGFVLLAGGTGSRMKANMPKQYLSLRGMPVLHHSLDLFLERLPAFANENGMR